jgi:hypothetical protein
MEMMKLDPDDHMFVAGVVVLSIISSIHGLVGTSWCPKLLLPEVIFSPAFQVA